MSDLPKRIVDHMLERDAFSAWLGIRVTQLQAGEATVAMKIRAEMLNGFGQVHGGITYSLADSALAFAANGHGNIAVAIDNCISYPNPVNLDDELSASAREVSKSNRIGTYQVEVKNQNQVLVALFKGTVYRTSKKFFEPS